MGVWRAVCVKTIFLPKTSVSRATIRFRGHDSFSRRRFSFRSDEFFFVATNLFAATIRFQGDDFFKIKRQTIGDEFWI